jgi:hypothetical protein
MTGPLPVLDYRPVPHYVCTKHSYDKVGAQTVVNHRSRRGVRNLRIYYCAKCNAWHVTKKEHYDAEA